jgi:predicted DNA-binding transcriptional regulator YafY
MRTLRLFALLDLLRLRREPVSAETLAETLGVTARTIYRDMASLQAMGAPVRGEAGVGYQMEKGYFLPPLQFDADELDAIALGARLVASRGDEALAKAAERAASKIGAVLSDERRESYQRLPLQAVSHTSEAMTRAGPHLPSLRAAIRERRKLAIAYLDLKGARTERVGRPLGLTCFDSVWLLTIWCEMRNDFRSLRVDRIEAQEPTRERFRPEKGKRFEDFLASFG